MSLMVGWFELDVYKGKERFVAVAEVQPPGMTAVDLKREMIKLGGQEILLFSPGKLSELYSGMLRTHGNATPRKRQPVAESTNYPQLKVWDLWLQ